MTTTVEHPSMQPGALALEPPGPARWLQLLLLAVITALALGTAGIVGAAQQDPTPGESSPEAGFARDMQTHHAQAVAMALAIRDRTSDFGIRALASDIMFGQTQQMGQLFGWLSQWGLKQGSSEQPMAWMTAGEGHDMGGGGEPAEMRLLPDGRMPGMATQAQVNSLSTLPVPKAEILFLQLMIQHHQGAIPMANAIIELSDRPEVQQFAQNVINAQTSEINAMRSMLDERGAPS